MDAQDSRLCEKYSRGVMIGELANIARYGMMMSSRQ